eukprot:scaffold3330_cov164-Amphora_coffeaeformis.AAC.2
MGVIVLTKDNLIPKMQRSGRNVQTKGRAWLPLLCCIMAWSSRILAFQSPLPAPMRATLTTFQAKQMTSISFSKLQHAPRRSTHRSSSQLLQISRSDNLTPDYSSLAAYPTTRTTAVYALILCNLVVFLADKAFRVPFVGRKFYLFHSRWSWWQLITCCFCHADRNHLSSNLFLLLLFGRSVEDDLGWGGLLLSYVFCGIFASAASLILLPATTVSIGASGAVFGLFAVSMLTKLSWREVADWRKVTEVAVLGEFVFRTLVSELTTTVGGGVKGINHVAHLSGAAAGALMVFCMRATVASFERKGKLQRKK